MDQERAAERRLTDRELAGDQYRHGSHGPPEVRVAEPVENGLAQGEWHPGPGEESGVGEREEDPDCRPASEDQCPRRRIPRATVHVISQRVWSRTARRGSCGLRRMAPETTTDLRP